MRQGSSIWSACGGLLAMAAAIGIGRFVYTPILPLMLDGLHWSKADAGYVASANFLGYLIGAVIATRPITPNSQRSWLLVSLLISSITTAGMALDTHVVTLAALRFVGGVASAFVIVIASTLVLERLSVPHRGHLSAVHFAGVGAGIIVSAAGVSAMVSVGAGWRTLWIGSGAIALVATSLVALLIGGKTETTRAAATSGRAQPLTGLPFLVVAYGLFGFGYVITATFLVALVRMTPEVRSLETWIWVLFGFSALPSVALWSWVGSRIGLLLTFNLACLAEAIGVAASVEWVTMFGIFISAVLLGGTFMGITAIGLMAARQLSGAHSQRAIGLMTTSFAVGQMIGPTVAGVLFDRLGSFRAPSLVAAVALVIAAALALVTSKAAAQQKLIQ